MKFSIKDVEEFMVPQKDVSGQIAKVFYFNKVSGTLNMYFALR